MPTRKRPANHTLQQELDAFYAKLRARALIIAIEWAGSASNLGMLVGYGRYTGISWAKRGRISTEGAMRLERLSGFPLTLEEMTPGQRREMHTCPKCRHHIKLDGARTGTTLSFNSRSKDVREARRIHAQHVARRSSTSSTPHD